MTGSSVPYRSGTLVGLGWEWGLGERLESGSENQGHLHSSGKMTVTKDMDPEVEPPLVQILISWVRLLHVVTCVEQNIHRTQDCFLCG